MYYLLENGTNLKITGLNWRGQPGSMSKRDAYSSRSEDSVPYIEIGPGRYALLEFTKSRDDGSGWIAEIWVEEESCESEKCAEILALVERYPDPSEELDSVGWSELLTLEARCHNLIARKDAQERAIALAEKAIALNPRLARAWNAKGAALAALGKDGDAIQLYLRAIRLDSALLRSWVNLGNRYNNMGDIERSIFAYRIATGLHPRYEGDEEILQGAVNALNKYSDICLEIVRLAGSRIIELDDTLSGYADSEGEPMPPSMARGLNCARKGMWKEATVFFEEVCRDERLSEDAINDISCALIYLGRYDEALKRCEQSIAISPENAAVRGTKACALIQKNRIEEALKCYEESLILKPGHPSMLYARALLEDAMGRRASAARCYREFLSFSDDFLVSSRRYAERRVQEVEHWEGISHFALCTPEIGIESCSRRVDLSSGGPDAAVHREESLKRRFAHMLVYMIAPGDSDEIEEDSGWKSAMERLYMANWAEAKDLFEQVVPRNSNYAAARCNKALCLYALGQYDAALNLLDGNLKKYPDHVESMALRAEILLFCCRLSDAEDFEAKEAREEALRHYRRAVQLDAGHSAALYCKALAEDAMGHVEDAYRDFCQFMAVTPGDEGEQVQYARRRLQELAFWKMNRDSRPKTSE